MPAHKREFQPGNIICRPGELYAGPRSAEVDPGPTFVDRDINMPAGTYIYAGPRKPSAGPEMSM
jgi:hypothetical protein